MYRQVPLYKTHFTKPDGKIVKPLATFKNEDQAVAHVLRDGDYYVLCLEIPNPLTGGVLVSPTPFLIGEIFEVMRRLPTIVPVAIASSPNPVEALANTLQNTTLGEDDADSVASALYARLSKTEKSLLHQAVTQGPILANTEELAEASKSLKSLGLVVDTVSSLATGYTIGTSAGLRVFTSKRPTGVF